MILVLTTMTWAGHRLFVDPLPVDRLWPLLLLPLLFTVCLVYKTLKLPTLDRLPQEAFRLSAEVTLVMVLLAAVLRLVP